MEQDLFGPRTTQGPPQNALLLAKASLLAYQSPESIIARRGKIGIFFICLYRSKRHTGFIGLSSTEPRTFRFVKNNDMVIRVPTRAMGIGTLARYWCLIQQESFRPIGTF